MQCNRFVGTVPESGLNNCTELWLRAGEALLSRWLTALKFLV